EILGVVGGSGTGKSVLLNTILGLKQPEGGTVALFGRDLHDPPAAAGLERPTGGMFQGGALFSSLTVGQNVEAPIIEHTGLPKDFVHDLARLKIRLVGLADRAVDKRPSE